MAKELLIKVCGMRETENIRDLANLPIDYMGHIFYAKSPRFAENLAVQQLPNHIKRTGVFVNADFNSIMDLAKKHGLTTIQLHGDESPLIAQGLKAQGLEIIKAFGIDEQFDWSKLQGYAEFVDYFLFDSKSPAYGGTGQSFNWQKLKEYPLSKPYFLSGGLSLNNLKEAIAFDDERLVGLDLNSKFEIKPGLKNIEQLTTAVKIIRNEQISSQ